MRGNKTVIPLTTLRELFAYNYWARDRQLEVCRNLTSEQFRRPLGNSFPSLHETLVHLVGSEWVWLERLQGRSPQALPESREFPTLETVAERWRLVQRNFLEYLANLSEEQLGWSIAYTNFSSETWSYPAWIILLHLMNHQTYHRGQVTTLLRQLGVQAAEVDWLVAEDCGLFQRLQTMGTLTDLTVG